MENPIKMDAFGGTTIFGNIQIATFWKEIVVVTIASGVGGRSNECVRVFISQKKTKGPKERNLSREKKLLLSIESWLFNRDPCKGFIKIPI